MTDASAWRRGFPVVLMAALWLVVPTELVAHPLGNFSVNHYAAIHIAREAIEVRYLIDMAEIPTFQELQAANIPPQEGHPSLAAYVARRVETLRDGLILELNGRPLPLQAGAGQVLFPPGAGGLPTLKLGAVYRARLDEATATAVNALRYRDQNFPGRAGWKEIVITAGEGITLLRSSAPERDRSRQLADYPTDLLNSPPQDLEAQVVFRWLAPDKRGDDGPAPVRLQANQQATPRNAFTELVSAPQLSLGLVVFAAAVAAGLGAFHALEPGHGKTVVAAYLVGSRGTAWHALILGLIVTGTHTAGVYGLGAVTLLASHYIVPERLYPWLGVLSGVAICALGCSLLLRRRTAPAPHGHDQRHDHGHPHPLPPEHAHHHPQPHGAHAHPHPSATVSRRDLMVLGVTGGIVPCPAALVVLLSAIALGRVGFGLLLIMAFSVGLAAVLVAIGILMVYAQRFMARFHGDGALLTRWLPLTSAAMITLFGVVIAVQALVAAGILHRPL
jgi:nickel/cobalt exporter